MRLFRLFSLFAFTLCFAISALAQAADAPLLESVELKKVPAAPGPIVINWKMKKLDGAANLVVNPDGSWIFSGDVKAKEKDRDFDVALALKSSLGSVVMFRFVGDASKGVQWSKQGKSTILKDNFKTYAAKAHWTAAWSTPLTAEGRKKLYEEQEAKKKKLKAEELAKEQQEEAEKAQAAQQQSSGGGGSDVGSTIGTIVGVVGTILAFL